MNLVTINLDALRHNYRFIDDLIRAHGGTWTLVSKVLCGHKEVLHALVALGVDAFGDSRLDNLRTIRGLFPDLENWYLRVPGPSSIADVAALTDVSLNSEIQTIQSLNAEASRRGKPHGVVIMIELGDLREGILPGSLTKFYESAFDLSHIEVRGIGANLGCLAGVPPSVDQFMQLVLYRELLELKFKRRLPLISAGTSVALPLLRDGQVPRAVNHFRIGEALFLGTDLMQGGVLAGLRDDVILLRAEIVELKEKGLGAPVDDSSIAPFASPVANADITLGQRGYRALVSVGQLDTDIAGLTPVSERHKIAGASSDITVVNLGDDPDGLAVGDFIEFRPNYAALLRLMHCRYITKAVTPSLEAFRGALGDAAQADPSPDPIPNIYTVAAKNEPLGVSASLQAEGGRAAMCGVNQGVEHGI